jgi:hypothetical protein
MYLIIKSVSKLINVYIIHYYNYRFSKKVDGQERKHAKGHYEDAACITEEEKQKRVEKTSKLSTEEIKRYSLSMPFLIL